MTDTKDTADNKLTIKSKKTLSLKGSISTNQTKPSFAQGRGNSVVVETKRKRIIRPIDNNNEVNNVFNNEKSKSEDPLDASINNNILTSNEKDARTQALIESKNNKIKESKNNNKTADEEDNLILSIDSETDNQKNQDDKNSINTPKEVVVDGEVESSRKNKRTPVSEDLTDDDQEGRKKTNLKQTKTLGQDERRKTKLTITKALDDTPRHRSLASIRRRREREKRQSLGSEIQQKISREVILPEAITIQDLANRMAERSVDVIKLLMKQGQMSKITDIIDADTAQLIAEEMGHVVKRVSDADVEEGLHGSDDLLENLESRAPVVTIMGHVDHGKTSLLDALRQSNVVTGEAGGITQHIGAYQLTTDSGNIITFLDTPGHAAFTSMRARGAKATDIVVLVVAADDGVMPQTIEAINHSKEAGVPIIVAINKIDVEGADSNRVRSELLQHGIIVESMSGDILEVEVSALKKQNLDKLLDAISLQSELLELTANPNRAADGMVIESTLDRGRGPVATVLVQRGKLNIGDIVVLGSEWGKVRALANDRGESVKEAIPSMPVEILGINGIPEAGDKFAVVDSESRAREITEYRKRKLKDNYASGIGKRTTLEYMMGQLKEKELKELPILLKADAQGSVEAIAAAINNLSTDEVAVRLIHGGVGGITESDISLALASNAIVLSFNVRPNVQAKALADKDNIEIRQYSIIYNLIDDIKSALSGLLDPTIKETIVGNAKVLEVFYISKVGKIAGCTVTDGIVKNKENLRLIRDSVVIHEGQLSTLKRFTEEVKEVRVGQECGIAFKNHQDIKQGDIIECYELETIERTL
ncbi:translation initiation factor IF-2 [Hyphomicrobiales bacterium]|jgi:translation initiation factor IF-2|nr:translation initiation factor IF-2 [Hyphomicrobiales bacterium]